MTKQHENFRVLVVLSLATWAFAQYVSFNAASPSAELQDAYAWRYYGQSDPLLIISFRTFWVADALLIVGLLGMFFYLKAARIAVILGMLLQPLAVALSGLWVSSPLEDTFWSLHGVFFTFTVGMAFFSDAVHQRFQAAKRVTGQSQNGS